jgi:homocysteine S-methyltransferase
VNCCAPGEVAGAAAVAREVAGKPVIVQPNSGEGWDPHSRRWTGPARYVPADATAWLAAGARIVGGCCRVGPALIAQLARVVAACGESSGEPAGGAWR